MKTRRNVLTSHTCVEFRLNLYGTQIFLRRFEGSKKPSKVVQTLEPSTVRTFVASLLSSHCCPRFSGILGWNFDAAYHYSISFGKQHSSVFNGKQCKGKMGVDVKSIVRRITLFIFPRYPFVNVVTLLLLLAERASREK
jgi:hypothetical protein